MIYRTMHDEIHLIYCGSCRLSMLTVASAHMMAATQKKKCVRLRKFEYAFLGLDRGVFQGISRHSTLKEVFFKASRAGIINMQANMPVMHSTNPICVPGMQHANIFLLSYQDLKSMCVFG
jgi:hypothetical protein